MDFLDRIGRPLLRLVCVSVIVAIGSAIAYAFWKAALTGQPIPDMSGGLSNMAIALVPLAIDQFTRNRERLRQIDRGSAPGPFAQSPPSEPEPETWPRPFQE